MKRTLFALEKSRMGKTDVKWAFHRQPTPLDPGVPIGIVSKVILRHANPSTTQKYLGTVGDVGAMRWIDNLYG